jgi:hypothetical protein
MDKLFFLLLSQIKVTDSRSRYIIKFKKKNGEIVPVT